MLSTRVLKVASRRLLVSQGPARAIPAIRYFSASSDSPSSSSSASTSASDSITSNLTNLFSSNSPPNPEALEVSQNVASNIDPLSTLGNGPVDQVMALIENTHMYLGIPYWETIALLTVGLRVLLLPVSVKAVINGARMAVLKPDMQKLQDTMMKDPNKNDPQVQARYQAEMKNLFTVHNVNPIRSMLMPMFQIPIFISVFMALRKMGETFEGFAAGGDFWFVNLAASDPTYIFPIYNALTFLTMLEIGADGMAMEQKQTFKTVMRGMSVLMIPLTASMPAGVFVYWSVNNTISIFQSLVLKSKTFKTALKIPDPPKFDAKNALKIKSPMQNIREMMKELSTDNRDAAKIVDGSRPAAHEGPLPVMSAVHPRHRANKAGAGVSVNDFNKSPASSSNIDTKMANN